MSEMFTRNSQDATRQLRNTSSDVKMPKKRACSGQKSLPFRSAKLWNSLDTEAKQVYRISKFCQCTLTQILAGSPDVPNCLGTPSQIVIIPKTVFTLPFCNTTRTCGNKIYGLRILGSSPNLNYASKIYFAQWNKHNVKNKLN